MGCAASSDTGNEYASLGHHGTRNVSTKTKTPTDTQLYGNSRSDRRKSSSSSSSSSSSDGDKKKSNDTQNHVDNQPAAVVVTTNHLKEEDQRQKSPVPPPPTEQKQEVRQPTPPPPVPVPVPPPQEERKEDRQPTPPPPPPTEDKNEDRQLPPVNQEEQQRQQESIPLTQEDDEQIPPVPHPVPPTQEDRQPTPTPKDETQQPPSPLPPTTEDQPPPPPDGSENDTTVTTNTREPPPTTTTTTPAAPTGNIDFTNTDNMETPKPPEFGKSEYIPTDVGTFDRFIDFRTTGGAFSNPQRPMPNDDGLYTDHEFTADVALPRVRGVGWQRPSEFAPNPALFTEGTTRFDIGQGRVGTCWFLSMVANIADKPRLLKRVIPGDYKVGTPEYDGVFHCRFWRFGQWSDIYIDDHLPISGGGQLFGAHSNTDPNEMWVALLEKAFARMYGSYDEVSGGRTADAFMNLTAGVGEVVKFDKTKMDSKEIFQRLSNAFQSPTTMVGCVCPDRSNGHQGLVGGHAYSMNGTYRINDTMLVRLRNPWGRQEWSGPWSDGSSEMSQFGGSIPHPKKDDGEFYMDIHDFLKYFEQLTICNLTPDVDRDGDADTLNYVTSVFGNWRKGKAGGFQKKTQNPLYCVTIPDNGADGDGNVPFVVQIVQKTTDRQDDKIGIRVDMYKVLYEDSNMIVLDEIGEKNNMYLIDFSSSFRFCGKPGKYVAIPSTMNSGDQDNKVYKEFLLRFFTGGPVGNPFEVEDSTKILSGKGPELEDGGKTLNLGFTQCFPGKFVTGHNAGGQISCRTFGTNPQLLITVNEPQHIKVEIMQPDIEQGFPLGIKLFKNDEFTQNYDWFASNYNSALNDLSGNDGPFSYGNSIDCGYSVNPGTYLLILHANGVDDQNDFAIAVYSEKPLQIRSSNL